MQDKSSVLYLDLAGKVDKTKQTHTGPTTINVEQRYDYDHAGRVLHTWHKINSEPDVLVARYRYNALGQLIEKDLHSTDYPAVDSGIGQPGVVHETDITRTTYNSAETALVASNSVTLSPGFHITAGNNLSARIGLSSSEAEAMATFIQSIDYRYNIRGWMKSINNSQLTVDNSNDDADDYFGLELEYNDVDGAIGNTAFYNGNVSAVKWKGVGMNNVLLEDTDGERSYKFNYDKSDRLTAAYFAAKDNGSGWSKQTNSLNEFMTYDPNGNLTSLNRFENVRSLVSSNGLPLVTGIRTMIDYLTYTYEANSNKLLQVEDTGTDAGFVNGTTNSTEYTYNTEGSLTKDDNKGVSNINYNDLGKPVQMTFTNGNVVDYVYDAAGTKIKTITTIDSNSTTTDYVGSFVYTNNTLSFFGSPEGRVVAPPFGGPGGYEYQYAIADHQGNTRLVFSSEPQETEVKTATFEGDANDNVDEFINVDVNNVVPSVSANHTVGGLGVVRMNQTYKVGPGKSFAVFPGDEVDIEVWEYHESSSGYGTSSTPLNTLIGMVATAIGGVNGGAGEAGLKYNGVNSALSIFGTGGNQGDTQPAAYLNYILFDKSYKVLDAGWKPVPATTFTKQQISFSDISIKEAGYLYTWLSYDDDSNNWVYFDDFKVTHTKGNIIQYNEYYPFGLQTANSWTRENTTGNQFLANGGTELNSTSSLYDLAFRNYDPVLGRMNGVDMMASKYASLSPYNFAFNDPVGYTDPSGADPYHSDLDIYNSIAWGGGSIGMVQQIMDGGGGGGYGGGYGGGGGAITHSGNTWTIHWNRVGEFGGTWNYQTGYRNYQSLADALSHVSHMLTETGGWEHTAFGPLPPEGRRLAVHTGNGDFVQLASNGQVFVPYTNISYWDYLAGNEAALAQLQIIQTGFPLGGNTGAESSNSNGLRWDRVLAAEVYIWGAAATIAEHNSKPLYQGAKSWAAEAKLAGKVGNKLGALGLVLTGVDMVTNGVNASNSLDATFGLISFAGPVGAAIGGAYFLGNLITIGITGKSIGEHIDDNFYVMSGGVLAPVILIPKIN